MNSTAKASKFKDGIFWVRRNDSDLLVISIKYVDELRGLSDSKASSIHAHIRVSESIFIFWSQVVSHYQVTKESSFAKMTYRG